MLDYEKEANKLDANILPNIDVFLETTPTQHPYVARICPNQGHVLVWYTDKNSYPSISKYAEECKGEQQTFWCKEDWKLEYGMAILYPYENELIVGTVKYYGYMKNLGRIETNNIIKRVWSDIITMFGNKKIICPSGTYMELLHMVINHKRIPRNAYKKQILVPFGFKRNGDYWIRDANLLA
jgi:hypothetical protein